jgi:xanthine/uracil permease
MQKKESWFPKFKPYQGNLDVMPVQVDEYLPAGKSMVLGLQHAFAMFGATVLAPLLMGFDPNLTIFITGIGTILFFLMTGGRILAQWLRQRAMRVQVPIRISDWHWVEP